MVTLGEARDWLLFEDEKRIRLCSWNGAQNLTPNWSTQGRGCLGPNQKPFQKCIKIALSQTTLTDQGQDPLTSLYVKPFHWVSLTCRNHGPEGDMILKKMLPIDSTIGA